MKDTRELLNRIRRAQKGSLDFLNEQEFRCPQIRYYLAQLLQERGISAKEYIRAMNLDRGYGYQLLNGRRKPSREHLIQTAVLLHLDLDGTQRLLKIGGREILYPRVKKDALAVYALEKRLELEEYRELMDGYERDLEGK